VKNIYIGVTLVKSRINVLCHGSSKFMLELNVKLNPFESNVYLFWDINHYFLHMLTVEMSIIYFNKNLLKRKYIVIYERPTLWR
jgi:hypothetical protein